MKDAALDLLAERLDDLVQDAGVSVTENLDRLVVRQLSGDHALELIALLDAAALCVAVIRDKGGEFARDELRPDRKAVQIQADLPPAPNGVERILTLTAFIEALRRQDLPGRVWVRRLTAPFETLSVRFGPWGDGERDTATEPCTDPRRVMRAIGGYEPVDADLCRWLLVAPETFTTKDSPAFAVWRARASTALAQALATEIDADGVLLFRGPPVSRFSTQIADKINQTGFLALQRAARWTYLNAHELEQRHALMSAEVARIAVRNGDLPDLADAAGPALEGARVAYTFSVQQQSRETLKALSDLRKAVLDEATKLTDINRGLASAVGGAVFGGIGLLIARLTLPSNGVFVGSAALLLGLVLTLHVVSTIVSGVLFVRLQNRLRAEWRHRLYAFLGPEDYSALVSRPVGDAERGFWVTAWLTGVTTLLVFLASIVIFLTIPGPALRPLEPVTEPPIGQFTDEVEPTPPAPTRKTPSRPTVETRQNRETSMSAFTDRRLSSNHREASRTRTGMSCVRTAVDPLR